MKKNTFPVYPEPKFLSIEGQEITIPTNQIISFKINSTTKEDYNLLYSWAKQHNRILSEKSDGNINLNLNHKTGKEMMYINQDEIYSNEIYKIKCSSRKKVFTVEIFYSSKYGLRNALSSLSQILKEDSIAPCSFADYPAFKIRGIIEGYYGPPWSEKTRLEIFDFLAENKFNAYFYGPKDDPFHRERWRDFYDKDSLKNLKQLVDRASEKALNFWYTLGPGLSIKYSSEKDISDLINKYLHLAELGIRHFGLLFDDINNELQHNEDRNLFTDLPEAHIIISNRIYNELISKYSNLGFVVCPTQYHGKGNEYYISRMGDGLDPRIEIFWTGPEICSKTLSIDDTSLVSRQIHRPVLFWDNYPVNDLEMAQELHIGPYTGRDRHLFRASAGVVANGMEYPESSKIAFHTIGAYLWNPVDYNPEIAWDIALKDIVGNKEWEIFRIFADNSRYSSLYPDDSPQLNEKLHNFEFEYNYGDRDTAVLILKEIVTELQKAADLFKTDLENTLLQKEILPWTEKFSKGTKLLSIIYSILLNPEKKLFKELTVLFSDYQSDKIKIFADVIYPRIQQFIDSGLNTKD